MAQLSFLSIALNRKKLRCERFLDEMSKAVPWQMLVSEIQPYYAGNQDTNKDTGNGVSRDTNKGTGNDVNKNTNKGGRPQFPIELMLKIHCLQQWYNLSDPAAEDAIYDRCSFQKFLALDLISDRVPDETTILNFRHLLEKHNLSEAIFDAVNHFLEEKNLLVKEGTAVDATLIAAPTSTKNKDKSRDPEMSSTKKNNQWHFGMKAHIGVQTQGKPLVHSVAASTAKEHDSIKTYDLLHGEENAVFGDKAYDDQALKQACRQQGIFYGITNKAKSKHSLSAKQKKRNQQFSSVRAKVEHPFQVIKCIWNYRKVRYRGLKKNMGQLNVLFALSNLFMIRKQLLPIPIHI